MTPHGGLDAFDVFLPSTVLHLISHPLASSNPALSEVPVFVDRQVLAKRLWRGAAEDGAEFGFQLLTPLKDGETVWQTDTRRYTVRQRPEPLVEISLELTPSAAAGMGWAIGNLHLELSAEATRLLTPDEPAIRQLLARLQVPFRPTVGLFRPGHFVRGSVAPSHELGSSHPH